MNASCDGKNTRARTDPMKSDQLSSFLFGHIFFDEPASTSPKML